MCPSKEAEEKSIFHVLILPLSNSVPFGSDGGMLVLPVVILPKKRTHLLLGFCMLRVTFFSKQLKEKYSGGYEA